MGLHDEAPSAADRRAMRSVPAAVWTTDSDLRVTAAFGGLIGELGFEAGEVIGQTVMGWFGTDDSSHRAVGGHRRALAGEKTTYTISLAGHDLAVRVAPLREGGAVVGTVGIASDSPSDHLVAQQGALAALGLQAVRGEGLAGLFESAVGILRRHFDSVGAAVVEALPDGRTLRVLHLDMDGAAVVPRTFARQGTLVGRALDEGAPLITDDYAADARLTSTEAHAYASAIAAPIRRRVGDFGALSLFSARRHAFAERDVFFVRSVANVLSGAIEREEALSLATAAFAATPDTLAILDDDGTILDVNDAAEQLTGRPRAELVGQPVGILSGDPGGVGERMAAIRGGAEVEADLLRPDGGVRRVIVSGVPDLRPGRHLFVARDLTDRRRIERELQEAQKTELVASLAAGIAHDFNNLLVAVRGLSAVVLDELEAESPLREDVEAIHAAGERGIASVGRLLRFARPPDERKARVIRPTDLVAGMQPLVTRFVRPEIELRLAPRTDACVLVDPADLEQAVLNLMVNAQDAIAGAGRIDVALDEVDLRLPEARAIGILPDRYVRVFVADDGAGMDAETVARAAEPFFTTKPQGSGLGLAMVDRVVRMAGGAMTIESEQPGGTRVALYLPVVDAEPDETVAAGRDAEATQGSETILVVDDDPLVVRFVDRALTRRGYTVVAETTPDAALARLAAQPEIGAAVLDVVMPEVGGRELARRLRELRGSLPVCLVSGYSDQADDVLAKPFTEAELARAVRRAIDGR